MPQPSLDPRKTWCTVREGPTDEHAEAPLEADAADGIDGPDAATGNAGTDAGIPPMLPGQRSGVGENKNAARNLPNTAANCCTN